MIRFQILRSEDERQGFYWRIVAANRRILATSETYTRKIACQRAIAAVCDAEWFEVEDLT